MKILLITGAVLLSAIAVADSDHWTLSADAWARPRDGGSVAAMAPLPQAVKTWSEHTDRRLVIHYPGGEDGQLWAFELRSWLVALGVPQENLELVAGSQQADRIEIELSR
jgi:hypothetical protein